MEDRGSRGYLGNVGDEVGDHFQAILSIAQYRRGPSNVEGARARGLERGRGDVTSGQSEGLSVDSRGLIYYRGVDD